MIDVEINVNLDGLQSVFGSFLFFRNVLESLMAKMRNV